MKELAGMAMNSLLSDSHRDPTKLEAKIEVIFVTSEPQYRVDQAGQMVRQRETESTRIVADTKAWRKVAADLLKWADEEDATAARWSAPIYQKEAAPRTSQKQEARRSRISRT